MTIPPPERGVFIHKHECNCNLSLGGLDADLVITFTDAERQVEKALTLSVRRIVCTRAEIVLAYVQFSSFATH